MRSRVTAAVCILGLIVAGLIVDSRQSRPDRSLAIGTTLPSPTSAAWFCAATANEGSVLVRNSGEATSANASFVSVDGRRENTTFEVPANSQAVVRPADAFDADLVSTSINSSSTDLTVSHRYDSDEAPLIDCQRRASTELTFVDNQTLGTSPMNLVLFNPFPDDAVVNVTFDTELGPTDPDTFDGVVVPPRSVVVLDVAAELRRREWVTSHVTVRRGRVAAESLQGQSNVEGLSLAAPMTALREWKFGAAQIAEGAANRVSIFNPGDNEVGVTAAVTDTPADVIPFTLRVPSHGRVLIDLNAEARVPKDVPVGITVTGNNNDEVIARRF